MFEPEGPFYLRGQLKFHLENKSTYKKNKTLKISVKPSGMPWVGSRWQFTVWFPLERDAGPRLRFAYRPSLAKMPWPDETRRDLDEIMEWIVAT